MAKLHKIKDRLGRLVGGKKDHGNAPASVAQTATFSAPPVGRLQNAETNSLNLVNYSQEELLGQIDHTLSRVHFGLSHTAKWMEGFSEFWSWMGPLVLLAGTIGEVFIVLWTRQKIQDIVAGMRAFPNPNKVSLSELKQAKSILFKLIKKLLFSGLC